MPKRSRMSVFCRALTFISNKFRFFASENAEFYFPFVVRSLRDEHTTNRLEAERKHHSSCLSCATKAQRMSGRIFLFPLLSLASLLSLSYVFLGNSMFSLAFCTCPPLPIKEKEGWWTSKIIYKHILLQISHKCIFFNLYFFLHKIRHPITLTPLVLKVFKRVKERFALTPQSTQAKHISSLAIYPLVKQLIPIIGLSYIFSR